MTGHDLIAIGLAPGPSFKGLLDRVREAQLEGTVTTPPEARELVDRLLKAEDREAGTEQQPPDAK